MFEDNGYRDGDEELPTWLILPAVLIGLGILAALAFGYMALLR